MVVVCVVVVEVVCVVVVEVAVDVVVEVAVVVVLDVVLGSGVAFGSGMTVVTSLPELNGSK